jgi:hypothetical protein
MAFSPRWARRRIWSGWGRAEMGALFGCGERDSVAQHLAEARTEEADRQFRARAAFRPLRRLRKVDHPCQRKVDHPRPIVSR